MLIEPGVEVKNVINQAPSEANGRGTDLGEKRNADPQVPGGLLPRQATRAWQREGSNVTAIAHPWPFHSCLRSAAGRLAPRLFRFVCESCCIAGPYQGPLP